MSNEANLSRMQHVRWWLGFGANRLFCQRFKVITQLPTVVLGDNSGLTLRLDLEPASDDTIFFDRVATLAGHQAFGRWESQTLERGCASVPSFLTGTRDVGRAPSQAFPPRPGGLAQELWEGGGKQACRWTASTLERFCNLQMCREQTVRGQPAEASLLGTHRDPPT